MPAVANVDGEIVPLAEARVPVTDRGFLWGDHAFEIIRAVGGVPCDGEAHFDRLVASCALLGIAGGNRPDPWWDEMERTLAAAAEDDAAIRVIVTRGDRGAGLSPRSARVERLVIIVEPLGPAGAGVRLHSVDGHRGGLVPAEAKTGNYLGSILALAAAEAAGADDALLHDGDHVLETATASLIVVRGGELVLPTGPRLPGVTAARVCALFDGRRHARALPVSRADLRAADELLVTSARRGVVPVIAVDGVARTPGPVAAEAAAAYDAWIASHRARSGPAPTL